MNIRDKLPDVGTTIFTVISQRAAELGAVNIGQGFPDYPIDPLLTRLVAEAMAAGHNQYAPMTGVRVLREAIAVELAARHGIRVDPDDGVTITLGAAEALFCAIQALVGPGDEAIVFDPAYDAYDPAVRLAGAHCVHVPLLPPAFAIDWQRVEAAVTPRTRLVIINSPHNPSCTVLGEDDLRQLAVLAEKHDLAVLSDEVYEHIVHAPARHASVLAHAALRARSVSVHSFGKSLHATGLRVGFCVAPPPLTTLLRKVHQFNTFAIATALQHAIAGYLAQRPGQFAELAPFFARKQQLLAQGLAGSAFTLIPAQGTFFALADYSACERLAGLASTAAARQLLEEAGVATIPLDPFYRDPPGLRLLRLCVAKEDETLQRAVERLRNYG